MQNLKKAEEEWEEEYKNSDLENIPLRFLEPPSELVRLIAQKKIKVGRAIDLGCGMGITTLYLAKKGFDVIGLDISKTALAFGEKRAKGLGINCQFVKGTAQNLGFIADGSIVFAYDRGCFHHIEPEDREKYIKEVHRILENGGSYFLECYNNRTREVFGHKFSEGELRELFGGMFKIKFVKEVKNISVDGTDVFLYAVFMRKL